MFINILYLVAAALFIFGLKGLTHPRTAVRGNLLGSLGMFIAVIATLFMSIPGGEGGFLGIFLIFVGVLIGAAIGATLAIKVEMTDMPELVGLYNGFGGAASVAVAGAALVEIGLRLGMPKETITGMEKSAVMISGFIGAVTLLGSLAAFAKLREFKWMPDGHLFTGHNLVNLILVIICIILSINNIIFPGHQWLFWLMIIFASVLGVMLVIPIGGADMPVVIALLNSYSGLAAAATGFVIDNTVLIISGSLVGSSGLILTSIMCKAMNRSLANVLFGGLLSSQAEEGPSADDVYEGKVKSTSPDEVAMIMEGAQRVVIIPGYGMAVAQAQHIVKELHDVLEARGTSVEFGIHPVAGRMPGHMNVLLAEADVPYEKMIEMDELNPTMNQVDVAVVLGANDVVNPESRTNPASPIAGMPIIDADYARTVIVVKRSLSPGFAGIPNPLFALPNTQMMFGDGKKAMIELVSSLKEA